MKRLLIIFASCLLFMQSIAQTTATDFTATDCNGVTWNLYTELNNGKIVVLVWVMPCVGCIPDAQASYAAANAMSAQYPGRVTYWFVDDLGNTSCSSLMTWAASIGVGPGHMSYFDNSSNVIDQNNYGGVDMPHVVVIGGSNHHIYANIPHGVNDSAAIANAITAAATTGVDEQTFSHVRVYPNPFNNELKIVNTQSSNEELNFELVDCLGNVLKKGILSNNNPTLFFEKELSVGRYFLKCNSSSTSKTFSIIKTNF